MRLIDADKIEYTSIAHLASYPVAPSPCDTVMRAEINAMPTVEASPVRHGYWRNYKDEHTCSCCGETVTGDWYDQDNDAYWYCPWCGAKMDAERKEE